MDIIQDFIGRVAQALGAETFTNDIAQAIEGQLRLDWGGDRPYVPKAGESAALEITRRDISIRREHRQGESISLLSRRHHLSRRRIYQIITG